MLYINVMSVNKHIINLEDEAHLLLTRLVSHIRVTKKLRKAPTQDSVIHEGLKLLAKKENIE